MPRKNQRIIPTQHLVGFAENNADNKNNYTITDNGNNTWTLTNNLKSKLPLILTFSNSNHNVEYTMEVQLKAMF